MSAVFEDVRFAPDAVPYDSDAWLPSLPKADPERECPLVFMIHRSESEWFAPHTRPRGLSRKPRLEVKFPHLNAVNDMEWQLGGAAEHADEYSLIALAKVLVSVAEVERFLGRKGSRNVTLLIPKDVQKRLLDTRLNEHVVSEACAALTGAMRSALKKAVDE